MPENPPVSPDGPLMSNVPVTCVAVSEVIVTVPPKNRATEVTVQVESLVSNEPPVPLSADTRYVPVPGSPSRSTRASVTWARFA